MSAPWEVFVEITTDDERTFVGDAFNEHTIDHDVRYLRADLTCGECVLYGVVEKCPLRWSSWAGQIVLHPPDDHPACMAFVPKEQR